MECVTHVVARDDRDRGPLGHGFRWPPVTYGTGTATAVVRGTGAATEHGRISTMLKEATELQTPLTKALQSIGKYITLMQLRFASFLAINLRQDFHLQECARTGRT